MKPLSIAAAVFALLSLVGFLVNFSLNNVSSLADRWEEDWHDKLHMVTWFMNDGCAAIAILLVAIGLFIQARNSAQPQKPPFIR